MRHEDAHDVVRSAALSSLRVLATGPGHWYSLVRRTAREGIGDPNPYLREMSLALGRQINVPGYRDWCRELRDDRDPMVNARAHREPALKPHLRWRTTPSGLTGE